jgi:hypothetical protein
VALVLALVAAAVVASLVLRATPARELSPPASSGGPHAEKGSVVGSIRVVGGPAGVYLHKAGGRVSVYSARGRLVGRLHVKPGRDFHVRLAPGRYRVGYGLGRHPRSLWGCPRPAILTVRPGRTSHENVLVGCDWM